jgi:hypothetical protein
MITREDYEDILKPAVDATAKHADGVQIIYDLLGISRTTASYIRRSEDYLDYKSIIRERASRQVERRSRVDRALRRFRQSEN